jgi:phospholipid-binding lipoprotein MlaA
MDKRFPGAGLALALLLVQGGCGPAPLPTGINDPDEAANREVHEVNKALDRALVGPSSEVYGSVLPGPVRQGVSNLSSNLTLPGDAMNSVLQGRPGPAIENAVRFLLNSTVGVVGLFDPAGAIGIEGKSTDFGETLHVWGVPEGTYVELPVLGPSTSRDLVGRVVDVALDPVRLILPGREGVAATVAGGLSRLGDRYRFDSTVDSVLYDSADSYAQTRLLYLQNRRFELGQTTGGTDGAAEGEFIDPYEE